MIRTAKARAATDKPETEQKAKKQKANWERDFLCSQPAAGIRDCESYSHAASQIAATGATDSASTQFRIKSNGRIRRFTIRDAPASATISRSSPTGKEPHAQRTAIRTIRDWMTRSSEGMFLENELLFRQQFVPIYALISRARSPQTRWSSVEAGPNAYSTV